jgi:hypothetical protein
MGGRRRGCKKRRIEGEGEENNEDKRREEKRSIEV